MRAFSHGCVRLKDPRGMAAAVLGTTVEHIAAKLKQGHSTEKTTRKIPVYVAYFTAWPDKNGKVEYFADIYERDARAEARHGKDRRGARSEQLRPQSGIAGFSQVRAGRAG